MRNKWKFVSIRLTLPLSLTLLICAMIHSNAMQIEYNAKDHGNAQRNQSIRPYLAMTCQNMHRQIFCFQSDFQDDFGPAHRPHWDLSRRNTCPIANGAECRSGRKPRARVLIPPGYLHPGKALAKSKVHH